MWKNISYIILRIHIFSFSDEENERISGPEAPKTEESILLTPPPTSPPQQSRHAPLSPLQNLLKRKLDAADNPAPKQKPVQNKGPGRTKEPKVAKPSKSIKDAEKLVNKQTDKTEAGMPTLILFP